MNNLILKSEDLQRNRNINKTLCDKNINDIQAEVESVINIIESIKTLGEYIIPLDLLNELAKTESILEKIPDIYNIVKNKQ